MMHPWLSTIILILSMTPKMDGFPFSFTSPSSLSFRLNPIKAAPTSTSASASACASASANGEETTGAGYDYEDYASKRSSFEPTNNMNMMGQDSDTPWPNYYCAPDLSRTLPPSTMKDPEKVQSLLTSHTARFIPIWKGQNLIRRCNSKDGNKEHDSANVPGIQIDLQTEAVFLPYDTILIQPFLDHPKSIVCHVGSMDNLTYFALDISYFDENPLSEFTNDGDDKNDSDDDVLIFEQLRSVGGTLTNDVDAGILATSRGLCTWHRSTKYCSKCGSKDVVSQKLGTGRKCQSCNASYYPRIDPSMIALITDSTQQYVLLGRKKIWPSGRYSILAGFTEIGESLEECVAREVLEESGVNVERSSISFFSSQPWPFPRSLMIGFIARALPEQANSDSDSDSDEDTHTHTHTLASTSLPKIEIDINEMEDIQWFSKDQVKRSIFGESDSKINNDCTNIDAVGSVNNVDNLNIPGRAALANKMLAYWASQP